MKNGQASRHTCDFALLKLWLCPSGAATPGFSSPAWNANFSGDVSFILQTYNFGAADWQRLLTMDGAYPAQPHSRECPLLAIYANKHWLSTKRLMQDCAL